MLLPPLDEQHRIVDILEQADQVIDSASSEVAALHTLLESSLRGEAITARGSTSTIAGLCLAIIGGIWGLPPGQAEIDVYALGPRIFSQGSPYFSTVGSPKRSVTDGQLESRLVQVDDIILERSGGGPDQPVGRVVYAPRDLEPCIPTDFMRLLRCNPELVEPRYLYWRLRGDYLAGETRSFQRQTTGINNLSVPAYLARQIEVPDRTAQTSLVGCWDSMAAAIVAASTARDAHKQLRTALLNDLISGEHRIGREYDDLLEAP
jgi:type I restriction enzyme S subunit